MKRPIRYMLWVLPLLLVMSGSVAYGLDSDLYRSILRHHVRGEHAEALVLLERYLEQKPDDATAIFLKACAQAQVEDPDTAARTLMRAVERGFRDISRMQRERALDPIRDHVIYESIVEAFDRVAQERRAGSSRNGAGDRQAETPLGRERENSGRASWEAWRQRYGTERYRYEEDRRRNLLYATALDHRAHRQMREVLEELADHLAATLFGSMPGYEVLVAIPTPADARREFERPNYGGRYEHRNRRLISRDTGAALRHEFFHLMHFGHMERLNQPHRYWVQEGLAALYEDYEFNEDGSIRFLPSERTNVVRQRARSDGLMPWSALFDLSGERFMARATLLYPQVRSIFRFVAEEGKLTDWYEAYVRHFEDDPSGRLAFEIVFDQSIEAIERQWVQWAARQAPVARVVRPGDASLGIESRANISNDGVAIIRVFPDTAAALARLRAGDEIVAVDGEPTRTMEELRRVLSGKRVGQEVRVEIRRAGRYREIPVVLEAYQGR